MPPKKSAKSKNNNKNKELNKKKSNNNLTDTDNTDLKHNYNEEDLENDNIDEEENLDEEKEEDNLDDKNKEDTEDEENFDNEEETNNIDNTHEEINDDDNGCLYNFTKSSKDISDGEYEEEIFDDDIRLDDFKSKFILGEDRLTGNVMTKYERVRILAERSKQLMLGAKPMLKDVNNIHPKDIARLELEMGVIPYKIHRERPDGKIEEWKTSELKIVN